MTDFCDPRAARDFDHRFRILSRTALLAAAVVAIHAALAQRALYADGAHFLLTMFETGQITCPEESRRTIHTLQQWPTLALLQSGFKDRHGLSVAYGLTVYLLPVLFTAVCYPLLTSAQRAWFLFPLLNYLAGSTAAGFPGISEGPMATGYFWLLLYAVSFLPPTGWWQLITATIAIPAIHAHEVFGFLAPVLAVAAGARSWRARDAGNTDFYRGLMLWFCVVAAVQIRFVLVPVVPSARDSFFEELIGLVWLIGRDGRINIPALVGLAALAAMGSVAVAASGLGRKRWIRGLSRVCVAATGCLCVVAVAAPFLSDRALAPGAQFAARNHPALMAVPLAALALASITWPGIQGYWKQSRHLPVVALLAVGTLGWQAAATVKWAQFTAAFQAILQKNTGLVPWTAAMRSLPAADQALFQTMYWPWTNPTLSLLLSPDRRVRTLIANPEWVTWQPFDPADPKTLPHSDLFDTSDYVDALPHRSE